MSNSFFVRVCMFTVSNALLMSSATAMCWWYPLVEARCDSVVDVVKGSCGGVFGFGAVLCMMLLVMYVSVASGMSHQSINQSINCVYTFFYIICRNKQQ